MLISLGKLFTAFKLSPDDLTDLRTLLPTKPVIPINRLIIDPNDRAAFKGASLLEVTDDLIFQYATKYSSQVKRLPLPRKRLVELVLDHLLATYRELESEEGLRAEFPEIAAGWRNEHLYGLLVPHADGSLTTLKTEIFNNLIGSYVFFSYVVLDEAVQFLYGNYYPFHREVKGLTRERYLEIIKGYFTSSALEPETGTPAEIESSLGTQLGESDSHTRPKGIKPSVLVRAIKDEAIHQGLDESYAVTVRTIWNWRKNVTAPPTGFSEEVMKSEETASAFAKKYIEHKVAEGSSELASNAKKEVSYNPHFHGVEVETPEDALILADSFRDLALNMDGGKQADKRRKARRKDS
ncbi:hypothetical protein C4J81_15715 [Deltaproteobacteria bacterium Smac51]|nr:hypothetical protein C4J81_15715 [Deltaproteobacteria bacterium Smac51]